MSGQFQYYTISAGFPGCKKKQNNKKLNKMCFNTKQKELKLLLTELISRMNENRRDIKSGIDTDKYDIASK